MSLIILGNYRAYRISDFYHILSVCRTVLIILIEYLIEVQIQALNNFLIGLMKMNRKK